MILPDPLRAGLAHLLEGVSRTTLGQHAARISEGYRKGATSSATVRSSDDALAYAVARMPATYAATHMALQRLRAQRPEFEPRTLLDLGAGPGSATFAALDIWPTIERVVAVESNPHFRGLAGELRQASGHAFTATFETVAADITQRTSAWESADLVVQSYVLVEIAADQAVTLARRAYTSANQAAVLVEPGTPAGFARIRGARDAVTAAGAHVAAPCPGPVPCPMAGIDWCHFSVRLPRLRDHKLLKDADAPFEDERFSYLAVTRGPASPAGARILAEPIAERGGIALKLCTRTGLATHVIAKRDRDAFKRARKARWGDAWGDGSTT